jgi:ABC-type multidrug transport system fused ATPase/permease subunit
MKDDDTIEYSNWQLIKDIGQYIKPYRGRFVLATILRLSGDIVHLYPALALAAIVTFFSKYSAGGSIHEFWVLLGLWALAAVWRTIALSLAKYFGYQVSEKAALDSQLIATRHLFKLEMEWHEKENAGNKLKKIQRGGAGIDRIIRMWINNYLEISVNFIGTIYILSRSDWLIGLVMLFFLVTYFVMSFLLLRKATKTVQSVNHREEEMLGLVFQAMNNIRSVKVSGFTGKLYGMIESQASNTFINIKERILRFQSRGFFLNIWAYVFRLGTMGLIGYGIFQGHLEVGFLILFNSYFMRILESVSELSDATQDLIINKYGIGRMQEILAEPVISDIEQGKVGFPKRWKKISIKDLSFAYGEHQVLKNLTFDIKKGEKIGIIGLSGAGKSTLFKLLLKENEKFQGEISVDNLSIKKIKKSSYYNSVSVVLQDTEVFNFTLSENVTIASEKPEDKKKLIKALEIASVSDFAYKLPNGIDTFIGEKGIKLSGGEKQRLGIARAIYKQPQILFLDEATSHLDLESEEKIQDSLHKFFQKVTAVVIAHRLTTIKQMDKILVIENGKLIEHGNFKNLYAKKGRFYELWEKQKL